MTDRDYPRFEFPGFNTDGHCFLRVRVQGQNAVFLCAQLIGYHGTSITNGVEAIFEQAVKQLRHDGLYSSSPPPDLISAARRSRWIEYYPEGTGSVSRDSFALVAFDASLNPTWNFVDRQKAARSCEVEPSFLSIPRESLLYAP
ncbi:MULTISPECIES: hypothetical protein [unclassified Luteibacter]|uniref:hypothetical protein n=1 Tax=Luteibacter sp. PvP019 TaxID=3156436 RepID=UPI003399ADB9